MTPASCNDAGCALRCKQKSSMSVWRRLCTLRLAMMRANRSAISTHGVAGTAPGVPLT